MKKTYFTPEAFKVSFETEEILEISFTGNGSILGEKNEADKSPADNFGGINLF